LGFLVQSLTNGGGTENFVNDALGNRNEYTGGSGSDFYFYESSAARLIRREEHRGWGVDTMHYDYTADGRLGDQLHRHPWSMQWNGFYYTGLEHRDTYSSYDAAW